MKKKQPLWLWGILLIVGGMAGGMLARPVDVTSEFGRGQAFGVGLMQLAAIVAGAILIVVGIVRARSAKRVAPPGGGDPGPGRDQKGPPSR